MEDTNQEVVWKPVVGHEDRYAVSSAGQVRNLRNGYTTYGGWTNGYRSFTLMDEVKGRVSRQVHTIVATAFLGKHNSNLYCVNHKNGIKHDNNLSNLEWVKRSDLFRNHKVGDKISVAIRKCGNFKPIVAIDRGGKVIGTYDSIYGASKKTGISAPSICRALKNPNWSAGGYRWILHEG